ncbi:suppressor of fused domain protein [Actinomadura darangshiensis]|uniref:suppressor of fused domain protein n=1 Tax=Actinomadura darangshiensis TaxID=705336 RepID=UPI00140B5501|nr:suppressor of fused domain protein [Actinomadura darangshiensis]
MVTHDELVRVFGADGVFTLERADVESHGVRPADVEVLCGVGLPVTAGMFFTMKVDGPYEALTMFGAETQNGPARFLILGQGAEGDEIDYADHVRYAVELESGNVLMLGIDEGEPTSDAEVINVSLGAFVEFLYRIELRREEMAGASAQEARPYTEKLVADLKAMDERAFAPERFWGGVFEALVQTGVPKIGSREAIAAALADRLPDDKSLHWATGTPVGEGVQELSAHRADGLWLLVTWGFSDPDGTLDLDTETSGLGFELTMRVPRAENDEMPPGWALEALRKLGEYVFGEGYPFADGHRMGVAGPLGPDGSRLGALAFITDPHLGTIDTPGGPVEFITAVGITRDELAEAKATSNHAVLARLAGEHGVPFTDVTR